MLGVILTFGGLAARNYYLKGNTPSLPEWLPEWLPRSLPALGGSAGGGCSAGGGGLAAADSSTYSSYQGPVVPPA